jgi:hypothetical protein
MKVFGIGLSVTGTNSLNSALNTLGFNTVHYPDDVETLYRLRNGIFNLPCLDNSDGITDIQASAFFKSFDRQYPDSKFILTIRDKEDWLVATKRKFGYTSKEDILSQAQRRYIGRHKQWLRVAMYRIDIWDKEIFSDIYDEHIQNVNSYFKDKIDKLLVMNICKGDSWQILCDFLDEDIPNEEFPWLANHAKNQSKTTRGDYG